MKKMITFLLFFLLAGIFGYHQIALAADKPETETLALEVTAYCCGTTRCDGGAVRTGICAGKPEWHGKVAAIYLSDDETLGEFLGYFEVLDTGGDERIRSGAVLDIYIPDYDSCIEFGRKKVVVVFVDGEG